MDGGIKGGGGGKERGRGEGEGRRGREREREGGREGGRDGRREGGREGGREEIYIETWGTAIEQEALQKAPFFPWDHDHPSCPFLQDHLRNPAKKRVPYVRCELGEMSEW